MKYNKSMAQILADMNENAIEEGKMKQLAMMIKQKKSPEQIAKALKVDVKTIKSLMGEQEGEQEDPIDQAKAKIDKIKRMAVLKKKMQDLQKSEDTDLEEKVEYIEYKFRNSKQAVDAVRFVQAMNTGVPRNLDINSDQENKGIIVFDAGRDDFTKVHKMIVKKFRPQILAVERVEEETDLEEITAVYTDKKTRKVMSLKFKDKKSANDFFRDNKIAAGQINFREEVEDLEEFTDKQIERLRKEYESLRGKETGINPEKFKKLRGMMKRFPKANLLKLVKADIPVLTTGAKAALVLYHGMKYKQLPEELVPYIDIFADDTLDEQKSKFKSIDPKVLARISNMMRGSKDEKQSLANMLNYFMPPEVVDMVRDKFGIKMPRGKIKFTDL